MGGVRNKRLGDPDGDTEAEECGERDEADTETEAEAAAAAEETGAEDEVGLFFCPRFFSLFNFR